MNNKLIAIFVFCLVFVQGGTLFSEPTEKPPVEQVNQINKPKLCVAKKISKWAKTSLQEKEALVAIVARVGGQDTQKHDKTGMAHAGLAVYDPRVKTYIVYNLINTQKGRNPLASIWRTALVDFFYGQTGYREDALIILPDKETQARVYESILSGKYKEVFFTNKYNLLTHYNSDTSLNCNKWLLMLITAARINNYNTDAILQAITDGFDPVGMRLSAIEKMFVRRKDNVRKWELPRRGPINTVTIQSLYEAPMFEEKMFFRSSRQEYDKVCQY